MTVTYGQTTVRLAHRVRLRHAVTGATITAVDAALPARPEGWTCRVRDGEAIVTVRDHSPTPDAPVEVLLTVTDGRLKDLLTLPAPAPGDPPMTVRVALAAEVAAVDVPPAPLTLVVDLVERPSGDPATGRTLGVRASSGPDPKPTIALTESAP
ncbi:hypothetical protein, partial [uncultured Demequina sp.]|uniref:hypothetical protein n=1 Tax=uncultured Demequina sp. TaxID=693499 RepID=UPI0025D1FAF3